MEHVIFSKPCSGFLQQHLQESYHQWYVFFVSNAAKSLSFHSLRFITQALGFKNINGVSIQSVLEMFV